MWFHYLTVKPVNGKIKVVQLKRVNYENIVYIATLFLIIAGLSGCEKEIKDFDGEEGVYFYVQWGVDWYDTTYWAAQPYTKVEFIKRV